MSSISKPARERLIQLSRLLEQLEKEAISNVTSSEIERRTKWSNFTIRRDISLLGIPCASSLGYSTRGLKEAIHKVLGINATITNCCIVGLGRLGSALMGFEGFAQSSFRIVAGFDSNVNRTEILQADFPLYPTSKMEGIIKRENIQVAILAVPEKAAQEIATRLCNYGITGIVNYTSAILSVDSSTKIINISVIDALQNLVAQH
ncbi:MAG: redox-sensing transcriptional repressor Rex [Spirochaetaceae bacterium]|nr:redox-sensing transcriptional repressor Rex [Spirochaetaceae bacterium]